MRYARYYICEMWNLRHMAYRIDEIFVSSDYMYLKYAPDYKWKSIMLDKYWNETMSDARLYAGTVD